MNGLDTFNFLQTPLYFVSLKMVIAGLWLSVIQYKDDIVSTAVPFCTSFGPTSTCSQSALVDRIHEMFNPYVKSVPGKSHVFLPLVLFEVAGDYANPTVIVNQHCTMFTENPHCTASSKQGIGTRAARMLRLYLMGKFFASLKPHSRQFDLDNMPKSYRKKKNGTKNHIEAHIYYIKHTNLLLNIWMLSALLGQP